MKQFGKCRETKEVILKVVEKRNKENLHRIIVENVNTGGTIMTVVSWVFGGIEEHECVLFSVNHSYNFVDPINRQIHTQNIERCWRTLMK